MQTDNNDFDVSRIYPVPTRIASPDTEKWPISARLGAGRCVCDSRWQVDRGAEKALLGSRTHTHIYVYTKTTRHITVQIFMYQALNQTAAKMRACLLAPKKKREKHLLTDILFLKRSMKLWPLSCHSGKRSVAEETGLNTGRTDRDRRYHIAQFRAQRTPINMEYRPES